MTAKNIRFIVTISLVLIVIVWPFVQKQLQKQTGVALKNAPQEKPASSNDQILGSQIGNRTKTSVCIVNGKLPDSACTPGDIFPDAAAEQICIPGYTRNVRNVSSEIKNEVFAEYGITSHNPGEYEVDHLISLELGGSNDIANLWPEAAEPRPGFHEKDQVENYLHQQVCNGSLKLDAAQRIISGDWTQILSSL